MTTIVISAPWYKKDKAGCSVGKCGQSNSWETFFKTGIGLGYMLYPGEVAALNKAISQGSGQVVLLRTSMNHRRRAEARLTGLKKTPWPTGTGGWQYDVYFEDQKQITPYVHLLPIEQLKRNGVKIF